jgi:hypothetical protein
VAFKEFLKFLFAVNVSPSSDSYQAIEDIPIATVAMAWDNPETG